jgi:hypothetical protein
MTVYIVIGYDIQCAPYSLGVFSSYKKAKSIVDDYFDDSDTVEIANDYDSIDKTYHITKYNKRYDIYYEAMIIETTLDTPLT